MKLTLKGFLKGKLQAIGTDLKELKSDFKSFDSKSLKIEGKLNSFEITIGQFQSEVGLIKQTGKNLEVTERAVKGLEGDVVDDLEGVVEILDNLQQKNNEKI